MIWLFFPDFPDFSLFFLNLMGDFVGSILKFILKKFINISNSYENPILFKSLSGISKQIFCSYHKKKKLSTCYSLCYSRGTWEQLDRNSVPAAENLVHTTTNNWNGTCLRPHHTILPLVEPYIASHTLGLWR